VIPHVEKSDTSRLVNTLEEGVLTPAADTPGRQRDRKLIRTMILRAV
jgi:hypothetical protein